MEIFKVSGCGVSLICQKGEQMVEWIAYIVARGGVPEIVKLTSFGEAR
jgi:hypothetical protein